MLPLKFVFLNLIYLSISSLAFASKNSSPLDDPLNPFGKDYLSLELAGNYPIANSQKYFSPNKRTWLLGYSHFLSRHWNVGLSLGFKSLYRDQINKELALLSVSNQSLYVIRLFHPTYLMLGTKLIYLIPNEEAGFPLAKEADFETEIGAGAVLQLSHMSGPIIYQIRVDRWRGTKTNRLHGFELAMGISYQVN